MTMEAIHSSIISMVGARVSLNPEREGPAQAACPGEGYAEGGGRAQCSRVKGSQPCQWKEGHFILSLRPLPSRPYVGKPGKGWRPGDGGATNDTALS